MACHSAGSHYLLCISTQSLQGSTHRGAHAHAQAQDEAANDDHGDVDCTSHDGCSHNEGDAREDDGNLRTQESIQDVGLRFPPQVLNSGRDSIGSCA